MLPHGSRNLVQSRVRLQGFWVGGKQGSLVRASKGTFVKIRVDWQIKLFKTEDYLVILTTHSPKWHWRDLLLREEVSHR